MGKELHRIGAPFRQPEWSALALMEDPSAVVTAHHNFVTAGADVIIANTYAVVPFHLGDSLFAARGRELAELAGRLAREAADAADHPVAVAASLPPIFGSYQPDDFDAVAGAGHLDLLVEAQATFVDLWLVETIGSIAEAEAAGAAMERAGVEGERWFSFALAEPVPDGGLATLWSGESVEAATTAALAERADAVLLNCAAPETIDAGLPEVVAVVDRTGSPASVGAYANGFPPKPKVYSANSVILDRRDDLTPTTYAAVTQRWIDLGATIVGGCCGIHPEHIAEVAAQSRTRPAAPSAAGWGDRSMGS